MFVDVRLLESCALCGRYPPTTRDHVPPRFFLDDPLPGLFPVVAMCQQCNQGASQDEEYVACVIDVALHGGVTDVTVLRPKVVAALAHSPLLARRLQNAERRDGERCIGYVCEASRLRRTLEKVGRGLMAFEDGDALAVCDVEVTWSALGQMTAQARSDFMTSSAPQLLPEVGSRAFIRMSTARPEAPQPWKTLQPGRFAYLVDRQHQGPPGVRMLFSEYLAAQCIFFV